MTPKPSTFNWFLQWMIKVTELNNDPDTAVYSEVEASHFIKQAFTLLKKKKKRLLNLPFWIPLHSSAFHHGTFRETKWWKEGAKPFYCWNNLLTLICTFSVIKVKLCSYFHPYFIENRGVCSIWQICIPLERFFFFSFFFFFFCSIRPR